MSLLFFILLIGPLIFFHELGHFIAARAFDVSVTQFSVGLGPRLFSVQHRETEWVVGALPLGGYVKMLGIDPAEMAEIDEVTRGRAFWSKPIWQRSVITIAGPLANLLLPLPILIGFYALDDDRLPAEVGTVIAGMPAADAGLQEGDRILEVNGEEVFYFDELQQHVTSADEVTLLVERGETTFESTLAPQITRERDRWVGLRWVERPIIGISIGQFGSIIQVTDPEGGAALAGLRTFDRIVSVNGQDVDSFIALQEEIRRSTDSAEVQVLRPQSVGQEGIGNLFVEQPMTIEIDLSQRSVGWRSAAMVVREVHAGSPADKAGIQVGDELLSLDGRPYNQFYTLVSELNQTPGETHTLRLKRAGEEITTEITAVDIDVVAEFNQEMTRTFVGMRSVSMSSFYPGSFTVPEPVPMDWKERIKYGFFMGFKALFGFITGMTIGLWQLITGDVGVSSLGSPIMIFDLASRAGHAGWEPFLKMMALISINLAIINLLPIPVLDGGNLMLFLAEAVKRGPLSLRTRQLVNYIGLVIILAIFMLAVKNDIERYWSDFAAFFD